MLSSVARVDAQSDAGSVVLHPTGGPVGTRVTFEGDVNPTVIALMRQHAYFNLIHELPHCELLLELLQPTIEVGDTGHVTGSFVVGREGRCFQQDRTVVAVPGRYGLSIGCHACDLAEFQVTAAGLARTGTSSERLATAGVALVGLGTLLCLWIRPVRLAAAAKAAPSAAVRRRRPNSDRPVSAPARRFRTTQGRERVDAALAVPALRAPEPLGGPQSKPAHGRLRLVQRWAVGWRGRIVGVVAGIALSSLIIRRWDWALVAGVITGTILAQALRYLASRRAPPPPDNRPLPRAGDPDRL